MLSEFNQKLQDQRKKRTAKIIALRANGMSVADIAKKLKVTRQRVLQLMRP